MNQIAVILSGLHYKPKHNSFFFTKDIDFRLHETNIKEKIFNYFGKDKKINTFIATNDSPILDELKKTYDPVKLITTDKPRNPKLCMALKSAIDYRDENKIEYDMVVFTRFDIMYNITFNENNIKKDKLNIISVLEYDAVICDNFYAFPGKFLDKFYEIYMNAHELGRKYCSIVQHGLRYIFEQTFPVNYVLNERRGVGGLSSYKINFIENKKSNGKQLIDNFEKKNLCHYNIGKNSYVFNGNDGIMYFSKTVKDKCPGAWFGYRLKEAGKYEMSFEIMTECKMKRAFNVGIKLHNPSIVYDDFMKDIKCGEWSNIKIELDVKNNNDLLIFIVDGYDGYYFARFKNIMIKKI